VTAGSILLHCSVVSDQSTAVVAMPKIALVDSGIAADAIGADVHGLI
jgi:hypothetical protein